MTEIYVAMSSVDYEGSDVMKAFHKEEDAHEFTELCRRHQNERPEFPSNYEDDAVYGAYTAAVDAWRKAHPHIDAESADYFSVRKIEIL